MSYYRRGYGYRPRATYATLTVEGSALVFESSYDQGLVDEIKARVPGSARKWDQDRKVWIVDALYGQIVAEIVRHTLGLDISVPEVKRGSRIVTEDVRIDYLARTKSQTSGEPFAYAKSNGEWSMLFPETVLRAWFNDPVSPEAPNARQTFYAVLAVARTALSDEIKSAYRRVAKQWHPDVCKEPDAAGVFKLIQRAYDVLSDTRKKIRYDAGLALQPAVPVSEDERLERARRGYRAPLKCGLVRVEAEEKMGRLYVRVILEWQDIVDGVTGKTLITSWPPGADDYVEYWA